jgi:ABC-type multidrug transport system fused ATPase/permease subunit
MLALFLDVFRGLDMLFGSVGQGGLNRRDDALAIQGLLGDLLIAQGSSPLKIDGIVGPRTNKAILDYQRTTSGLPHDGRIDPNGPTLKQLDVECANLYASIAFTQTWSVINQFQAAYQFHQLPQNANRIMMEIRSLATGLKPAAMAPGADRFTLDGGFRPNAMALLAPFRANLLAATVAVEIIVVLIFLVFVLFVLTSNPVWQRAARDFVKGIRDRIRAMSQKLRDAVDEMIETIEKALEGSRCAKLCADELNNLKRLRDEMNDLIDTIPANDNDPEAVKAMKFRLARLLEEITKAQQAVIDCLARNGC